MANKKHNKYNIGDTIEVSLIKFPGSVRVFQILKDNIRNDSHGTIKLSTLMVKEPRARTKHFKVNDITITVEDQWFNEGLTGRRHAQVHPHSNCCGVKMDDEDILTERCPACGENCKFIYH